MRVQVEGSSFVLSSLGLKLESSVGMHEELRLPGSGLLLPFSFTLRPGIPPAGGGYHPNFCHFLGFPGHLSDGASPRAGAPLKPPGPPCKRESRQRFGGQGAEGGKASQGVGLGGRGGLAGWDGDGVR